MECHRRAGSSIVRGARVCGVEVVVVSHLGNQTDSDVLPKMSKKGSDVQLIIEATR